MILAISDQQGGYRAMPLRSNRATRDRAVSLRAGGLSYREIADKLKITPREARQLVLSSVSNKGVPIDRRALLTSRQAAEVAGIHINTLRRWGDQGVIKEYRIGTRGDRRFLRRDVEKLLKLQVHRRKRKTSLPD